MEITIKLFYDGAMMDKLTEIIKAETGSDKPVKQNQISKLYKELVIETINSNFDHVLKVRKQAIENFDIEILETVSVPSI